MSTKTFKYCDLCGDRISDRFIDIRERFLIQPQPWVLDRISIKARGGYEDKSHSEIDICMPCIAPLLAKEAESIESEMRTEYPDE